MNSGIFVWQPHTAQSQHDGRHPIVVTDPAAPDQGRRDALLRWLRHPRFERYGVDRFYVSVYRAGDYRPMGLAEPDEPRLYPTAALRVFNAAVKSAGGRVEALYTDRTFIGDVARFNDACDTQDERFDAVHLDYEPTHPTQPDPEYFNAAKADIDGLPLVIDMNQTWWDTQVREAIIRLNAVSEVVLMAYRQLAEHVVELATRDVRIARDAGKSVFIALETQVQDATPHITFSSLGEPAMLDELPKITIDGEPPDGFAFHAYRNLVGVGAWPVAPSLT